MRRVGVLGGLGPAAGAVFYHRLIARTAANQDQDHLHVLLDGDPCVPDRTRHLAGLGPDPTPALIAKARRLELAGAELLVIACNTASAFVAPVAAAVRVPLLDWVSEACERLVARLPSVTRVGVLATDGTLACGLYQEALERHGVAALAPDARHQELVMQAIYGPRGVKATSCATPTALDHLGRAATHIAHAGADVLLLACTELSVAAPGAWPLEVVDAADLVAERVVLAAGGELRSVGGG